METAHVTSDHPRITELKDRIKECRKHLLTLLEDWHYLQTVVQPRIMFVYESIFGDLEIKIQKRNRNASELERRVELLSMKIKRGEELTDTTIQFINSVVNREFRNRNNPERKHSSANYSETGSEQNYARSFKINGNGSTNQTARTNNNFNYFPKFKSRRDEEIPKLYRQIVKKLHPDASGSESDYFRRYWDNVQEAYRTENVHRLRLFQQTICLENPNFDNLAEEETHLRKEIRTLEMNIAIEKRKIEKLKNQEPFIFEEKLNDKLWIARRKRKLRDRLLQIDRQIQFHKKMLCNLTGGKYKDLLEEGEKPSESAFYHTYAG